MYDDTRRAVLLCAERGSGEVQSAEERGPHAWDPLELALAARLRPAVTLTTYAEIHAPMYTHLGFSLLQDDQIGPELRALRSEETEHGLDELMPRVSMRLSL